MVTANRTVPKARLRHFYDNKEKRRDSTVETTSFPLIPGVVCKGKTDMSPVKTEDPSAGLLQPVPGKTRLEMVIGIQNEILDCEN